MNNRLVKALIAGMMCLCMTITPAFGLEGEMQPEEQQDGQQTEQELTAVPETQESTSMQNSQGASNQDIPKVDVEEQIDVIEEDMKYLFVETKQLLAPGTQNIAVGWKDDINLARDIVLLVKNPSGETVEIPESKRTKKSVLFSQEFQAGSAGTYEILGVRYFVGDVGEHFEFDDVEIDAGFQVEEAPEGVALIDIENNKVNTREVTEEIGEVISESEEMQPSIQVNRPKNGSDYVVALDPGHSGGDPGAVNKKYKLNERTVNYKIAEYCRAELEEYGGVRVFYTYPKGGSTNLEKRALAAKNGKADLLVSLHCNAYNKKTRGCEVYYPNATGGSDNFNTEGKTLSDAIFNQLKALGITGRFTKSKDYPRSKKDYYQLIRDPRAYGIMSIIVEHCYIDNNSDANAFLRSESNLKKLGVADATGIAGYLGLSKFHFDEAGIIVDENGSVAKNRFVKVGKYTYRADEEGYKVTGYWPNDEDRQYYFGTDGIVRSNTLMNIEGKQYYLGINGVIRKNSVVTTGGRKYYFAEDGTMYKPESLTSMWIGCGQYTFTQQGYAYLNQSKAKKKLSIYNRPGSGKAGQIKRNAKFYVIGINGKWSQMANGKWIKTSYTKKTAIYPNYRPDVYTTYKAKLKKRYKSRSGPSTGYLVKKTYKKGKKVTVMGTYGGWARLTNGQWLPISKLTKY